MATKETTRFMALLAVGAASLVLAGCSLLPGGNNSTDTSSNDSEEGDDVFSIVVGDCLNDADAAEVVSTVPIVDCSEPHDSEAFYAERVDVGRRHDLRAAVHVVHRPGRRRVALHVLFLQPHRAELGQRRPRDPVRRSHR